MVELRSATRKVLRRTKLTALGLALMSTTVAISPALARHHGRIAHRARIVPAHRFSPHLHAAHARAGLFTPPFSMYAVDGNSGRVLYGRDENALRHPASITKVMTLYLLFEQLERGHLSLDSRIAVSQHAASQAPTKLGLRPGSTIRVEDAIKSIVTKSANDMAVAVAEAVGGDEATFARMMTRKAHALGMSRSNFVNASGLPDDMQITTAHDLAVLGRAIHDRYPRYFRFFSTPSFRYAGQFMPNHNHLMEQVEGMDGIKTGYTKSSGFNLLSSVNRNGHWLVSVVLGGRTRLGRDHIMADLIASQIDKCSTVRTAPMVAENPALEQVAEVIPVVQHVGDDAPPVQNADEARPERTDPPAIDEAESTGGAVTDDGGTAEPAVEPPEPQPPIRAAPQRVRVATVTSAVAHESEKLRPRPAFVPGVPHLAERDMTTTGSIGARRPHFDGTTSHYSGASTATPSSFKLPPRRERAAVRDAAKPVKLASLQPIAPAPSPHQDPSHGGWIIQIGAAPSLREATDLIGRAKPHVAGARPFTEKVQKGRTTLFRARFAGLSADTAASACRTLKRAGFSCFASRN